MLHTHRYGRCFDDFGVSDVYAHPWEVTLDEGMIALFFASFQDALPTYASKPFAQSIGLRDRPVHPLLLLNLGIGFSVHDVSEQAIANIAYLDVFFPNACFIGDTVSARSCVMGIKPVSAGNKGVVHVRTELVNQDDSPVCVFERKALVRGGHNAQRPQSTVPPMPATMSADALAGRRYPALGMGSAAQGKLKPARFPMFYEDFGEGDVFVHDVGRTVSEAEHMQLTTLTRNSHPLHFDERYCQGGGSFAKTRVVFGGLVLSWVLSLSSRDTAGNALWDAGLSDGAHPGGVISGDTLFAASKVLSKQELGEELGLVTFRVVGLKNVPAKTVLEHKGDADVFTPELGKTDAKVKEKVVEITRTLLMRRRLPGTVEAR